MKILRISLGEAREPIFWRKMQLGPFSWILTPEQFGRLLFNIPCIAWGPPGPVYFCQPPKSMSSRFPGHPLEMLRNYANDDFRYNFFENRQNHFKSIGYARSSTLLTFY